MVDGKSKLQIRLENQLRAKGQDPRMAAALLKKSGNLDKDGNPTAKGLARGNMTPEDRAKDRAAKYYGNGRKPDDFTYNPATNRATIKKRG